MFFRMRIAIVTSIKRLVEFYTFILKFMKHKSSISRKFWGYPGLERSPREGNVYPLQYSCLENPIDREAWKAIVHGVAKSQT